MPSNNDLQADDRKKWPNQKVQQLAILAGTWAVDVSYGADQPTIKGGTTFVWLPGEYFLEGRSSVARDDFPDGHMILGGDSALEFYTVLYFDSRGVARVYQMSLDDHVWKMWRDAPGFSQRFTGTFREQGAAIDTMWEISRDGTYWELDFRATYTKTTHP